jgi:hypothetical protein
MNLRSMADSIKRRLPPLMDPPDDPWPEEWGARLAEAFMDAHGAVLNATRDDELALRSAERWTHAFEAELRVNPHATRPRLLTFNVDGPAVYYPMDDDDPDAVDPEAAEALEQLIAQATGERDISLSSLP